MALRLFYALACCILIVRCDPEISNKSEVSDGPVSLSFFVENPVSLSLLNGTALSSLDEEEDVSSKGSLPTLDDEDVLNKGSVKNQPGPIVYSKCGAYQGSYMSAGLGIKYERFLGLPYAKPPVGELRFKKAVPYTSDANLLYDATHFCSPCMQPAKKAVETSKMEPSEDCLCLNIYRPPKCTKKDKKPVLVYLYESYFLYGSAAQTELNGGVLAALGDIVVVTLNYRLGAFGWLYGGVDEINGNMGASDAIEALTWVNKYIGDFCGDSKMITVGGHGAGALMALGYMFNYRVPDDLFQGVMVMSPFINQQSFTDSGFLALLKSSELLKLVNCFEGSKTDDFSQKEVQCVKKANAKTLAEASAKLSFYDGNGICSKSQLMLRYRRISIDDRLHRGMFYKGKYVYIGGVDTEYKLSLIGSTVRSEEEAAQVMVDNIKPIIVDQRPINIKEIVEHYLGMINGNDLYAVGKRTTLALNMACVGCPVNELVNYLSRYNKVYAYQYSYVASCDRDSPKRIYGAYHGDDVQFGFGEPLRNLKKYDDYDREVSRTLIGIWSDFIYQRKTNWPNYDEKERIIAIIQGLENYFEPDPYIDICEKLDA